MKLYTIIIITAFSFQKKITGYFIRKKQRLRKFKNKVYNIFN